MADDRPEQPPGSEGFFRPVPPRGEPLPAAPSEIAGCRVIRTLGTGATGIVYEVEQESPRRRVALKLLKDALVSERSVQKFQHEGDILARLEHPGIARIYSVGFLPTEAADARRPYLIMELVQGAPIHLHAAAEKLSRAERLQLLIHICDAVHYAHQQGVIHRDLKPANVLVDRDGRPRVLDFNLARLLDIDTSLPEQTATSQGPLGTLPFMSPEQAIGQGSRVQATTDIYSLGAMMYVLLTGAPPLSLEGMSLYEAVCTIVETEPKRLGQIDPSLRGDLDAIAAKALEKSAAHRYQSAAELAADIRAHLEDRELPFASVGDWRPRARKFLRRNRTPLSVATLLFAAVTTGLVATAFQARRAIAAEKRATLQLEQFRQVTRASILDLSQALTEIPGAFWTNRALIERAFGALDLLAAYTPDDPEARSDLADAYLRVAYSQGDTVGPNIGDADAALTSYARVHTLLKDQLDRNPNDRRARRLVQLARLHSAMILTTLGRAAEAEPLFDEGLRQDETLIATDPTCIECWLDGGSFAREWLRLLRFTGRESEAGPILARLEALHLLYPENTPREERWVILDGSWLMPLALLRSAVGRHEEALLALDQSEAALEHAVALFPESIAAALTLGDVHRFRAEVLLAARGPAAAATAHLHAADFYKDIRLRLGATIATTDIEADSRFAAARAFLSANDPHSAAEQAVLAAEAWSWLLKHDPGSARSAAQGSAAWWTAAQARFAQATASPDPTARSAAVRDTLTHLAQSEEFRSRCRNEGLAKFFGAPDTEQIAALRATAAADSAALQPKPDAEGSKAVR